MWVEEVWARPALRYLSVEEFTITEIECVQREDLSKSSGEAHDLQRYGQPKSKSTDK